MNKNFMNGIIDGYTKQAEGSDPALRALPPTLIGGGIGGLVTLLSNYLGDKKLSENLLRNLLVGGGAGFGSSLIFPGFGKKEND